MIEISSPVFGEVFNTSTVMVSGTVTDPFAGSGITSVVVNGVTAFFDDVSFTVLLTGLSDGSLAITAEVKDKAGNVGNSIDTVTITPKATENALNLVITNLQEVFGFIGGLKK